MKLFWQLVIKKSWINVNSSPMMPLNGKLMDHVTVHPKGRNMSVCAIFMEIQPIVVSAYTKV